MTTKENFHPFWLYKCKVPSKKFKCVNQIISVLLSESCNNIKSTKAGWEKSWKRRGARCGGRRANARLDEKKKYLPQNLVRSLFATYKFNNNTSYKRISILELKSCQVTNPIKLHLFMLQQYGIFFVLSPGKNPNNATS